MTIELHVYRVACQRTAYRWRFDCFLSSIDEGISHVPQRSRGLFRC